MYRIPVVWLQSIAYSIVANQKLFIVIRQIPWSSTIYFALSTLYLASVSLLKWATWIILQKEVIIYRKLVSNLNILANIFDSKYSRENKYLTDNSSCPVRWWLKLSILFIFTPVSTGVNIERYRRSSCIYQSSRFKIIYYSIIKILVDV